ncbi:MAG: glycosyltransferase [Nitrospinota bacterium]|nr:glycosyltransferase [Nitrospinota bacterium]
MQEKVCLIIPCYNEAERLDISLFNTFSENLYCLFVNDGSTDDTEELIRNNLSNNIFLLSLEENFGKAEAVRRGMMHAMSLPFAEDIDWIGYWDADLATPLSEVPMFIRYAKNYETKIDAIWGSRIYRLGSDIKRSFRRHILGRLFTTAIAILLKVKSYDSQCGAKLFRPDIVDIAFREPFISRWIFDVELLKRLPGHAVIEYPLGAWSDVGGSKMNLVREIPSIAIDILRIRLKY